MHGAAGLTNQTTSAYLGYSSVASLLGGLWVYDWLKSNRGREALRRAALQHQREEFAQRPPEIFAAPLAVRRLEQKDRDEREV